MWILGCDTSLRPASLALLKDGTIIATSDCSPADEALAPTLFRLLSEAEIKLGDVDRFAISMGPGSFTGLRIGLTFFKAMAHVLQTPLIGVDSFAAMTVAAHRQGTELPLLTLMPASRSEWFYALMLPDRHKPNVDSATLEHIRKQHAKTPISANGSDKLSDSNTIPGRLLDGSSVALCAYQSEQEGKASYLSKEAVPFYGRRSTPERLADERAGQESV